MCDVEGASNFYVTQGTGRKTSTTQRTVSLSLSLSLYRRTCLLQRRVTSPTNASSATTDYRIVSRFFASLQTGDQTERARPSDLTASGWRRNEKSPRAFPRPSRRKNARPPLSTNYYRRVVHTRYTNLPGERASLAILLILSSFEAAPSGQMGTGLSRIVTARYFVSIPRVTRSSKAIRHYDFDRGNCRYSRAILQVVVRADSRHSEG